MSQARVEVLVQPTPQVDALVWNPQLTVVPLPTTVAVIANDYALELDVTTYAWSVAVA